MLIRFGRWQYTGEGVAAVCQNVCHYSSEVGWCRSRKQKTTDKHGRSVRGRYTSSNPVADAGNGAMVEWMLRNYNESNASQTIDHSKENAYLRMENNNKFQSYIYRWTLYIKTVAMRHFTYNILIYWQISPINSLTIHWTLRKHKM